MTRMVNPLGNNNAETATARFRSASAISCLAGFGWLVIASVFDRVGVVLFGSIYFAVLCGVSALLCLAASLHTSANNALFRDRDEQMSSIRILEAERRDRMARKEQGQRYKD